MRVIAIRSWTEPFPSLEGVAVVFDIFRCSTTIHCLHAKGGPLYVSPSLKDAATDPRVREMRVFSELSQPLACFERHDNSPFEALTRPWPEGRAALVATTSGTPAMFAARGFERVYVGSLIAFSALVGELAKLDFPITLIPAARPGWDHVEDEIACQAVATALEGFANMPEFVRECAESAKRRVLDSPRPTNLAGKLQHGAEDVALALDIDKYQSPLSLAFAEGMLAEVKG